MKEFFVSGADSGMKLDKWCKKHVPLPYGVVQKLLRKKDIKIDGVRATADSIVSAGQTITIYANFEGVTEAVKPQLSARKQEEIQRWVIKRSNDFIIINKPAGLAVQGGTNIRDSIDFRLPALVEEDEETPKLVHRLDRDTSGVLLLGTSRESAAFLTEQFRARNSQKIYWALITGIPDDPIGEINLPLGKQLSDSVEKMSVLVDDEQGKEAITHYRVVESYEHYLSWVELRPITGRTHQLRVHMNAIGHPIIGDGKYGGRAAYPDVAKGLPKQLHLHARYLHLPKVKRCSAVADLPLHMMESWERLKFSMKDNGVSLLDMR
jgi:23S rRNA pseudouridine955/2504/2580 synthase